MQLVARMPFLAADSAAAAAAAAAGASAARASGGAGARWPWLSLRGSRLLSSPGRGKGIEEVKHVQQMDPALLSRVSGRAVAASQQPCALPRLAARAGKGTTRASHMGHGRSCSWVGLWAGIHACAACLVMLCRHVSCR